MESMRYTPEQEQIELAPEWQQAVLASEIIQSNGYEAVIVGGAVRDLLLGKEPKDFDIATNAQPANIESMHGFDRSVFNDTAQAYAVTRVQVGGVEMEIASYRKDIDAHLGRTATKVELGATLEDDLERRDFTINAMALDPVTNQLFYNGDALDDLSNGLIRFVGDGAQRIQEDPLRVLRAVRFKNRFGFAYEEQTYTDLKQAVAEGKIDSISGERLYGELTAMLKTAESRRAVIEDLDELGILQKILPELVAGKGVEQGPEFHAEGDVWMHQLLIMEALPRDASTELIWAALLHDIGKPRKQRLPAGEGERITFHGHDMTSAELARPILNKLKFSNEQKAQILWLIEHHINISQLPQMRRGNQKNMMNHPGFADLVELHKADGEASWRTMPDGSISKEKPQFAEILALWDAHQLLPPEVQRPDIKRDLDIDGHTIMALIPGFKQSRDAPWIGKVMRTVQDQYSNGDIRTRDQAIELAQRLIEELK